MVFHLSFIPGSHPAETDNVRSALEDFLRQEKIQERLADTRTIRGSAMKPWEKRRKQKNILKRRPGCTQKPAIQGSTTAQNLPV
jgi:hypothetical protein